MPFRTPYAEFVMRQVDLHAFSEGMRLESERASAIVGAAMLDACLEDLFRRKLSCFHDELVKPTRPLGTFSARIRLARALEWINDDARYDLDIIRRVRNDFAHSFDVALSFSNQATTHRCNTLRTAQAFIDGYRIGSQRLISTFSKEVIAAMQGTLTPPRSRFQLTVEFLMQYLRDIPNGLAPAISANLLAELRDLGERASILKVSATGTVSDHQTAQ